MMAEDVESQDNQIRVGQGQPLGADAIYIWVPLEERNPPPSRNQATTNHRYEMEWSKRRSNLVDHIEYATAGMVDVIIISLLHGIISLVHVL